MAFALGGAPLEIPRWSFSAAQAVVGCLVAVTVTPATLAALGQPWLPMLVTPVHIILSGALLGLAVLLWLSLSPSRPRRRR